MRILILGGTGFIGSQVTRRLIEQGHRVTLFHRGQTLPVLPPGVSHILGDRKYLSGFIKEFNHFAPDVVLDTFLYAEQEAVELLETFRNLAHRVVAISSMDVYGAYGRFCRLEDGPADQQLLVEDAPLRRTRFPYRAQSKDPGDLTYRYDKIPVESAIMCDAQLAGTVLRLGKVYGPDDSQHHLHNYLKRMLDGRPVIFLEESQARWRWTRVYVENAAEAIVLAITDDRAVNRIYNVGDPEAFTEREWVESIARVVGWTGSINVVSRERLPAHLAQPYDWSHHLAADTSRIRQELNYQEPVTLEEALRRTVRWERAYPPPQIDLARFDYTAEDIAIADIAP
jgi:nucleoside-diphosphate-sugar epimerase